MKKIGIDVRLTYYRQGGIAEYMRQLTNALAALAPPYRFHLLHNFRAQETLAFQRGNYYTPCHHRLEGITLGAEIFPRRFDLLHSPDFIPPLRGARRHVITVHDLTFLHFPQHKDAPAQRYYNDQIETAVRQADHILSVSEATKNDLMTMLHVSAEKITVQPHGVDERFYPMMADELAPHVAGLSLPESYILFVGTLEPRKNIPALLDAYAELKDKPPLLLVGKPGWLFDETMARIEQMRAKGHEILIRSDISDAMLPIVYNRARVLVLPSFYEGFGMPALEAMACGTPVVVSNTSSLPEVVGDVGLLIDPNDPTTLRDALEHTLTHMEWARDASERGIERAKQFTWENSAQIALSVYARVLSY